MTTLNTPATVDLPLAGNTSAARESLWARILERLGDLIGKSWNYLNEDMGPVDRDEDCQFTGGCCM